MCLCNLVEYCLIMCRGCKQKDVPVLNSLFQEEIYARQAVYRLSQDQNGM